MISEIDFGVTRENRGGPLNRDEIHMQELFVGVSFLFRIYA